MGLPKSLPLMTTEPWFAFRNHHFPARVEPISYSGVSYSCGYSVAIFLLKDDGKRRRAAANPWSLRTHEVRRDGRWEEGPAPHTQVCARACRACLPIRRQRVPLSLRARHIPFSRTLAWSLRGDPPPCDFTNLPSEDKGSRVHFVLMME